MLRLRNRSFRSYQALADWLAEHAYGSQDFADLKLKSIGGGSYRSVYLLPGKKLVVKIDTHPKARANRDEWRLYAKPRAISANGSVILAEYVPYQADPHVIERWREKHRKHIHREVLKDAYFGNVRKKTPQGPLVIVDYQTCFFIK
jgi:hypothetical protein